MATIISTKTTGGGGASITGDTSGILQLASADGTTAVTIDASQNVNVGTVLANQGGKLEASTLNKPIVSGLGQIFVYSSDNQVIDYGGQAVFGGAYNNAGAITSFSSISGRKENSITGNIAGYLSLGTNQNGVGMVERQRISATGIVTMNAYGAGTATFSAAGVISSVSDETWKTKDGVPLNPDDMIKKLEPGYWFYNEEKAPVFGAERQLGFYAQNVNYAIGIEAAPIPEEGKPWGYYDRSVLAVTVMSLQKALATIESLTARLDEQQAQISVLQGAK